MLREARDAAECSRTWEHAMRESGTALGDERVPKRMPPMTSAMTLGCLIFRKPKASICVVRTITPEDGRHWLEIDTICDYSPTCTIHSRNGSLRLMAVGSWPLNKPPCVSSVELSGNLAYSLRLYSPVQLLPSSAKHALRCQGLSRRIPAWWKSWKGKWSFVCRARGLKYRVHSSTLEMRLIGSGA